MLACTMLSSNVKDVMLACTACKGFKDPMSPGIL